LQSARCPLIGLDFERQGNWNLYEASDCCEALALLRDRSLAVLLCERDHADGNWEDLLKATVRLRAPPNLIVFSRLADESLWAKVLNMGGFDVLMTPFEPEEVLRVTFAARSRWERDFVANTSEDATRTGNSAGIKVAPPEEDWLRPERDTNAIIGGGAGRLA
jgi:DNA-binding response OmpR family regulator